MTFKLLLITIMTLATLFMKNSFITEAATTKNPKYDPCESVGPLGRYWSTFCLESKKQFDKGKKVPTFVITSWFERLGNHFIQIHRALRYAVCCRGRVRIRYLKFFYYIYNLSFLIM